MKQVAAIGFAIVLITLLAACKQKTQPLPPELAAIHCPADMQARAQAIYGDKVHVQHVCLDPEQARHPELIRCGSREGPIIGTPACRDQGFLSLSRTQDNQVYDGALQAQYGPTGRKDGPERVADIGVQFSPVSHAPDWVNYRNPKGQISLDSSGLPLPPGFAAETDVSCDAVASVLEFGLCTFRLRSRSMVWDVDIHLKRPKGTPISEEEYRQELQFFLPYFGKMVSDQGFGKGA